jgi:hypothetical protein
MKKQFENIKAHLENYYNLRESKRKIVQSDLLTFAKKNRDFFLLKVQEIKPSNNSVLFEIYEILSQEAEIWADFIISEFNRIVLLTEDAKKKEQESISDSLTAFTYFATQDFNGIDKLKTVVKSGLRSKSKNIVLRCLELLSDIYRSNKLKHLDCKLTIEQFQNSKITELRLFAEELIKKIDSPPKQEDSNLKKMGSILTPSYTAIIFLSGLFLTLKTIDLFQNSFVPFVWVVVIFIVGVVLSGVIHYFKVQNKTNLLSIVLGYGFISAFIFLFLNFSFPQSESINEIFEISKKGKYAGRRGVYIEFVRENKTNKLDYYRSEKEKVGNSNYIKIETAMGLFGFEIITEKELVNEEK